jgi:dTDP-L-rhamnose 4-epimerase
VKVLITGGAGFIGSYVADRLLERGATVRILDSLDPQVHPGGAPGYLSPRAELIVGDVRDRDTVLRAIDACDAVIHLAARVGVGQSMYEIDGYVGANTAGTAVLLQCLLDRPVKRLVVASSMSVYGEGRCTTPDGRPIDPPERGREQLERADWELRAPGGGGEPLRPVPTPEDKRPELASVYALSKYDQERLCLLFGAAYKVPTVALRLFNVYGPRQALSNPYTGVLAIFASRLLNGRAPLIFEDGLQRRDFVSVHDVTSACLLALESPRAAGRALNIGSGRSFSVREVALALAGATGKGGIAPQLAGKYRVGDIRHCFADIRAARELLGYEPRVRFEDGIAELAAWLMTQTAVDRVDSANAELARRGLTV